MSDEGIDGHGAELRVWMIQADRIAASSVADVSMPDPPNQLTPQEYLEAGFELYAAGCGRYDARSRFHINYSPDVAIQAMLWCGPPESRLARLWVAGKSLPVPVDPAGVPLFDGVAKWLDTYIATGLLQRASDPARATSLRLWEWQVDTVARQGAASFTLRYPAPPEHLTPDDCRAVSFGFHDTDVAYEISSDGATLNIVFSPDWKSQAVLLRGSGEWSGSLMWVDAQEVPVPRSKSGDPQCSEFATWLDARFVYVDVGGLWDHPLTNPMVARPLGSIRGLLLWDNERQVSQVFLPQPSEAWTTPILVEKDSSWHLYPDQDARKQGRADRIIPIPH